ncbi:MAG TPA: HEAT repeat domain-containing protein [Planctomycetota bacterium]
MPALRLLSILCLALVSAAPAVAQDPGRTFEEGMRAFRAGDRSTALSRFRDIVRMEPDQLAALNLLDDHQAAVLELMSAGGEYETFAVEVLTAARTARVAKMRDPNAARTAAQGVFASSDATRARAIFELTTKFGPFGAAALIPELDSPNQDHRLAAVYALSRMGSDAMQPLLAATRSDNAEVRIGAAMALTRSTDPRAAASLADMAANDANSTARSLAGRGGSGNASELHYQQGWAYYVHDVQRGLADAENYGVVFVPNGSGVDFHEVPRSLVSLELAKTHFARAAELGNTAGNGGLALAYGAEISLLRQLVKDGDDSKQESLTAQEVAALTLGQTELDRALKSALARDEVYTAEALCTLLDGPGLTATGGLENAVRRTNPSLRYAAALALARAGKANADAIVALGAAARLEALRVVLVVDPDERRREVLANDLSSNNVVALTAVDGAGGLVSLHRSLHIDAFVVADPLPDLYARRFVAEARKNPAFKETSFYVLGGNDTGQIEGANTVAKLSAAEVMAGFEDLDADRAGNLRIAANAAFALDRLSMMNPGRLSSVVQDLAVAAAREDAAIAVPALRALGNTGGPDHLAALAGQVGNTSLDASTRAAAANAIAGILSRNPGAAVNTAALHAAIEEGDSGLSRACARALGFAGTAHQAVMVGPAS